MSATETMRNIELLLKKHDPRTTPKTTVASIKKPITVANPKQLSEPVYSTAELEPLARIAWTHAMFLERSGQDAALWAFDQAKAFVAVRRVMEADEQRRAKESA